jgi:cell division initiation protein
LATGHLKGGPMKITPLEIRKHEFDAAFRGYDKNEVMSFLETIADEFQDMIRENIELKDRVNQALDRLASYTKIETALQNTLIATQETAEQMKNAAQEKSDQVVRRATNEADRIIQEAYEKVSALRQEYSSLKSQKASFMVNFKSLLESELKLMELMEKQATHDEKALVIKRKAELSDDDVERVVEEFKRTVDTGTANAGTSENQSRIGNIDRQIKER